MTTFFRLLALLTALLPSIALAQELSSDNISGSYLAEHDFGQMELIITQTDSGLSTQMSDGYKVVDMLTSIENDTLVFDTSDLPFTLNAKIVEDTIEMVIIENKASVENLELTFERQEVREAARAPHKSLTHLLQFVPATIEILQTEITYTNLWALSGFRNAAIVQSQQDFVELAESDEFDAYLQNSRMMLSTPFDSRNYRNIWESMPETVGFSWFDIQATLSYGDLPEKGYLALNTTDRTNIATALENLDFKKTSFQDYPVWTYGEDGAMDFKRLNPANPFGGDLGTAARVLLTDDVIGYGRFDTVIDNQVQSYSQEIDSLVKLEGFDFLISQVEDTNDVLFQSYFIPLESLLRSLVDPSKILLEPTTLNLDEKREELLNLENYVPDEQKELYKAMVAAEQVLPLPQQVVMSQYFKDDSNYNTSYATISLLYPQESAAIEAGDILYERLTLYHEPFETINVQPASVATSNSGNYFVVTVTVENLDQGFTASSQPPFEPFMRWVQAIYRSEFLPLYFF